MAIELWNGGMVEWRNGNRIANGSMAEGQNGGIAIELRHGRMAEWWVELLNGNRIAAVVLLNGNRISEWWNGNNRIAAEWR